MSPLTIEQARAELEAAGRPSADLNGHGPGLESTCPCCGEGGVMTWRPHDPTWRCANGCDPSRVADELHSRSTRAWNEAKTVDGLAVIQARADLEELWGLEPLGLKIVGARIVGRGSRASADVYFDDGSEMTFEQVKDAARPSTLLPELAACVGALPGLKQHQALKGVTLLRRIAEHHVSFTEDEIARDWGTSHLQSAETIDIDINDQRERWGAFSRLHNSEGRVVLRHSDGSRYVRAGWFCESVRSHDAAISPHDLAHRMERIGWHRRGKAGRIKATAPSRSDTLAWSFYIVPEGWEDGQ